MKQFLRTLMVASSTLILVNGCKSEVASDPAVSENAASSVLPTIYPKNPIEETWQQTFILKKGFTIYQTFRQFNVPKNDTLELIEELRKVMDLRRVRAKTEFVASWKNRLDETLMSLELKLTSTNSIVARRIGPHEWDVEEVTKLPKVALKSFKGVVETNLWESGEKAGMNADLIFSLAEIFAWQIDLGRDVRRGDRWRLTAEQLLIDGEPIGWGNVKVAEYYNGPDQYVGIYYESENEEVAGFYDVEGESLKKMFLKSPIKFGRITSGFSKKRFHPILKRQIPHNGVDYGAPRGTPVRSVGDGKVVFAGYNGASGKMVKIRHNSVYTTSYLHLSKIPESIRKGTRVAQGKVIGFVGSTGRATGPHLHFAFYERGKFVNPQGKKFPSKDPVPRTQLSAFKNHSYEVIKLLPPWEDQKLSWNSGQFVTDEQPL